MMTGVGRVLTIAIALSVCAGTVFAETRLCGHEPDDESVAITTVDPSASVAIVRGGSGGAPYPTEGDYLLKVDCGTETDEKVEVRYEWDTFTFDLDGNDRLLFDVYIPSSMNPILYYGVWDDVFGYCPGINGLVYDQWMTIECDVSSLANAGLDHIWAVFFENWAASDQTIYIDNLRLLSFRPELKSVTGQEKAIEVYWEHMDNEVIGNIDGYNVYRRPSGGGTWTKISSLYNTFVYVDFVGSNGLSYDYKVTSVVNGTESPYSNVLSATSIAQTDAEFIETLQRATFRFYWDYAHPVSGLVREYHPSWGENRCDLLGSGYGLGAIIAGSENGWITRSQAARRTLKVLRFLGSEAQRYHGGWSHIMDGASGDTIPFTTYDDGADIVLTALVVQNIIAAREYYTGVDAVETEIRTLADDLWRGVEWDWYRRMPETSGDFLYWHWSPNYGWQLNMRLEGWLESQETYIIAISSPTHPIPVSCYHDGWIGPNASWFYYNGLEYYGHRIWAGDYGALFVQQMPFTHVDPRMRDNICNYFDNATNWTLYHRDFCIDNPNGHTDYGPNEWGLSADPDPWGYNGHEPCTDDCWYAGDNGTISTTAILASMPYTPTESTAAARHIYNKYEDDMYGAFGFKDSYNRNENWFSGSFISVNMGTNFAMIENHRSELFWNLFMQDTDIQQALDSIGFTDDPDAGLNVKYYEGTWSTIPDFDSLTPLRIEVASVPMAYIRNREDNYGLRFSGYISIATAGTYTFYTNSDDGSRLYVNGELVVDNDGLHGAVEKSGTQFLGAGKAKIVVDYIETTGGQLLEVSYAGPGIAKQIIPVSVLSQPDTDPPTPNPAMFATAPYATGTTSIAMAATTGTDANGPIEYYFDETSGNPGGTDSGWQTSASYTDTGLTADTQYTYRVRMRDALGNAGSYSNSESAITNSVADINSDGVVDAIDVQLVINAVLGIPVDYDCDVNADRYINAIDVQTVINAALGLL